MGGVPRGKEFAPEGQKLVANYIRRFFLLARLPERIPGSLREEKQTDGPVGRDALTRLLGDQPAQTKPLSADTHLPLSRPSEEAQTFSGQQTGLRTIPRTPERLPIHTMSVAVRGATEQVAYTRHVRMREVTFTCTICSQTVTQFHYPSGKLKYCSDTCRAVRAAQRQEERVVKQREKRWAAREAHL
jgi:hypothetical protein